ncbi:hypothetical protein HOU02_gp076 [Caulobacter phage CcrBL9]|uniref:Uncharacterized protein n=1 Tax=Caulobacter phage CcrBL9 TaxID=2283270 RepID=A0A385EBS0_9CAUD|nr:hypothetical protein HOU02_gp076 [Caulobacter phage CcrBL9]AXQ69100.1 hypothetical protein CcrBL9_gp076c [Caulobacter phage CcrBL9]
MTTKVEFILRGQVVSTFLAPDDLATTIVTGAKFKVGGRYWLITDVLREVGIDPPNVQVTLIKALVTPAYNSMSPLIP